MVNVTIPAPATSEPDCPETTVAVIDLAVIFLSSFPPEMSFSDTFWLLMYVSVMT